MKKFIIKHPIISIIIALTSIFIIGYIVLLIIVFRPLSESKGRMNNYEVSWSQIEKNIKTIHIGMPKNEVVSILGTPDNTIKSSNKITLSYQQYGVIAPEWIYDINIENDTVINIVHYRF